jgi:hypothetical protein
MFISLFLYWTLSLLATGQHPNVVLLVVVVGKNTL